MTDDNKKQWYFNTVKKQAELGMVSPIEQRMVRTRPRKTPNMRGTSWWTAMPDGRRRTGAGRTTA